MDCKVVAILSVCNKGNRRTLALDFNPIPNPNFFFRSTVLVGEEIKYWAHLILHGIFARSMFMQTSTFRIVFSNNRDDLYGGNIHLYNATAVMIMMMTKKERKTVMTEKRI
ncbi:MAG TPA: hypothetical protein VFS97_01935 [Nitrososphaeraceae archaeon]|nr:hypothetical protein [Nitrososphaeraceae archaeon]